MATPKRRLIEYDIADLPLDVLKIIFLFIGDCKQLALMCKKFFQIRMLLAKKIMVNFKTPPKLPFNPSYVWCSLPFVQYNPKCIVRIVEHFGYLSKAGMEQRYDIINNDILHRGGLHDIHIQKFTTDKRIDAQRCVFTNYLNDELLVMNPATLTTIIDLPSDRLFELFDGDQCRFPNLQYLFVKYVDRDEIYRPDNAAVIHHAPPIICANRAAIVGFMKGNIHFANTVFIITDTYIGLNPYNTMDRNPYYYIIDINPNVNHLMEIYSKFGEYGQPALQIATISPLPIKVLFHINQFTMLHNYNSPITQVPMTQDMLAILRVANPMLDNWFPIVNLNHLEGRQQAFLMLVMTRVAKHNGMPQSTSSFLEICEFCTNKLNQCTCGIAFSKCKHCHNSKPATNTPPTPGHESDNIKCHICYRYIN